MAGDRDAALEAGVSAHEEPVERIDLVAHGLGDRLTVDGARVKEDIQQGLVRELAEARYAWQREAPNVAESERK